MRKQCHICLFVFYFRVMVLEAGKIVEVDHPNSLLKDRKSIFYAMAKDAGLVQQQHNADHYIIVGRGGRCVTLAHDRPLHSCGGRCVTLGRTLHSCRGERCITLGRPLHFCVGERYVALGRPLHSCGGEVYHIRQTITFLWGRGVSHQADHYILVGGEVYHISSWQTFTFQCGERLSHLLMADHYILVGGEIVTLAHDTPLHSCGGRCVTLGKTITFLWGEVCHISSWQTITFLWGEVCQISSWQTITLLCGGRGVSHQLMADHYILLWGERCFTLAHGRPLHSCVRGEVFHISSWQTITLLWGGEVFHISSWQTITFLCGGEVFHISSWQTITLLWGGRGVSHQLMADHYILVWGGEVFHISSWQTI